MTTITHSRQANYYGIIPTQNHIVRQFKQKKELSQQIQFILSSVLPLFENHGIKLDTRGNTNAYCLQYSSAVEKKCEQAVSHYSPDLLKNRRVVNYEKNVKIEVQAGAAVPNQSLWQLEQLSPDIKNANELSFKKKLFDYLLFDKLPQKDVAASILFTPDLAERCRCLYKFSVQKFQVIQKKNFAVKNSLLSSAIPLNVDVCVSFGDINEMIKKNLPLNKTVFSPNYKLNIPLACQLYNSLKQTNNLKKGVFLDSKINESWNKLLGISSKNQKFIDNISGYKINNRQDSDEYETKNDDEDNTKANQSTLNFIDNYAPSYSNENNAIGIKKQLRKNLDNKILNFRKKHMYRGEKIIVCLLLGYQMDFRIPLYHKDKKTHIHDKKITVLKSDYTKQFTGLAKVPTLFNRWFDR